MGSLINSLQVEKFSSTEVRNLLYSSWPESPDEPWSCSRREASRLWTTLGCL